MFGCARAGVIHLAGAPTTSGDGDSLPWGPGGLPLALRLSEGLGVGAGSLALQPAPCFLVGRDDGSSPETASI